MTTEKRFSSKAHQTKIMSVKKAIKGGGSIIVHNSELYSELMGNCTEQQNEEEVVDQKQVRLLH